ncbi:MAG TPA: lytic transglycosylase domain-containing protein [Trebonia sp.]
MRRLTFRRPAWLTHRPMPAIIGIGLAAASVAVGGCLTVVSGLAGPAASTSRQAAAGFPGAGRPGSPAIGGAGATALSLPFSRPTAMGPVPPPTASAGTGGSQPAASDVANTTSPRLIVPDVIAAVPGGVTAGDIAKLRKIGQVRAVLPIAGGRVAVNGEQVTVLGAPAAKLRPWMPPDTAVRQDVWADFGAGDLVTTTGVARAAGLRAGADYPVSAAVRTGIHFGSTALLGVAGVGGIVSDAAAKRLGLVRNVAVLVNAPAADMLTLTSQVSAALGKGSQVVRLVPVSVSTHLPVDTHVPSGRPASYLGLYQESAVQYCPGLSWTVLAAIGQIESGDGANVGPSTAGALGPMQFLPSTWKIWGMTAFGETGAPNIMDPFDAVPSAARMLCADGAASGGQQLRQAIFDYNHATWYVDEVLSLAGEYANEFS